MNMDMDEHTIPSPEVLTFGTYTLDVKYREALFDEYPFYTVEEIVGTYLGHNPYYPSQEVWIGLEENPSHLFGRRSKAETDTDTDTDDTESMSPE